MTKIRLHLPGMPHTITNSEFSHCAFTGKVMRFSPMMRSVGYEVYHYGTEGSTSGADKDFQLFTKEEYYQLAKESLVFLKMSEEDAILALNDPKDKLVIALLNRTTPLFKEFNRRFRAKLIENYRGKSTDLVCIPMTYSYDEALHGLNYTVIETGIGYNHSSRDFRIFESYCWLNKTLGEEKRDPPNYWFVIPNYFDLNEFPFNSKPLMNRVGFLGRIGNSKGCAIITECAKRFPQIEFVVCGKGDCKPYLTQPNIVYKEPIHGKERGEYLGSCCAVLTLSKFLEPFCGVAVEAQLCGTPVITHDSGGMVETVVQFKTGLRCHTLADIFHGIQMAIDGKFDRAYIHARATNLFDMYKLAHNYDYVFKSILEISSPRNGWYSPNSYINYLQQFSLR
jgi:glycosyltransferase involved in cell wall biosynthesis